MLQFCLGNLFTGTLLCHRNALVWLQSVSEQQLSTVWPAPPCFRPDPPYLISIIYQKAHLCHYQLCLVVYHGNMGAWEHVIPNDPIPSQT